MPHLNLEFPKVRKSEIPKVIELAHEIWHSNYLEMISKEQIEYMLTKMYSKTQLHDELKEGYRWHFISIDSNPVGYFCFYPKSNKMFLSKLYLKNEFQRKGIAQRTLDFIAKKSKEENFSTFYLTVNKNNHKALKCYLKFGFSITNSEVFDIGEGFVMDDYILEFRL